MRDDSVKKAIPTVIVTAGGTREDIDDVRFLTNISTGKLGAKIAEKALALNFKVIYIHTETSELPSFYNQWEVSGALSLIKVRSTKDAYESMRTFVPLADAVIHSMACGDFGFTPAKTKLKSNDPMAFIESLKERIVVNPKILSDIKKWNPKVFLVSFKFESGLSNSQLIMTAYDSMKKANGDLVVANDKQEMINSGEHIAYLIPVDESKPVVTVSGKSGIADAILLKVAESIGVGLTS